MKRLQKWIETHIESLWYDAVPSGRVRWVSFFFLQRFSSVYKLVVSVNRYFYKSFTPSFRPPVPLIVVGNLTVGGTGKTPMVIALCECLKQGGYRPGIISRGYGGKAKAYPMAVNAETSAQEAGDEAVLLARRTQVPVVVAPKRIEAIRFLLEHSHCNIILSDDGLQHWPIKGDIEILVIDGKRRFGNGHCLPAGPLRESLNRYKTVDFLVVNAPQEKRKGEYPFNVQPESFVHVATGETYPLDFFEQRKVHVVTGIGHPQRFLNTLKNLQIDFKAYIFPDHHAFERQDIKFEKNANIIMTEKDAVKCEQFEDAIKENLFYLKIVPELNPSFKEAFMKKLNQVSLKLTGGKVL